MIFVVFRRFYVSKSDVPPANVTDAGSKSPESDRRAWPILLFTSDQGVEQIPPDQTEEEKPMTPSISVQLYSVNDALNADLDWRPVETGEHWIAACRSIRLRPPTH